MALTFATHLIGAGAGVHGVSVAAVVGLLMVTVLLTLGLAALSGRRWTPGRALVALALGQLGLHTVLTVLLASPRDHPMAGQGGMVSMALAHAGATLLIGLGIAVSDAALDTYFLCGSRSARGWSCCPRGAWPR